MIFRWHSVDNGYRKKTEGTPRGVDDYFHQWNTDGMRMVCYNVYRIARPTSKG